MHDAELWYVKTRAALWCLGWLHLCCFVSGELSFIFECRRAAVMEFKSECVPQTREEAICDYIVFAGPARTDQIGSSDCMFDRHTDARAHARTHTHRESKQKRSDGCKLFSTGLGDTHFTATLDTEEKLGICSKGTTAQQKTINGNWTSHLVPISNADIWIWCYIQIQWAPKVWEHYIELYYNIWAKKLHNWMHSFQCELHNY